MASNWRVCIFRVGEHEATPSVTALLLGRKKQRFSGTNQKPGWLRPFGTGPLKACPQGLVFSFLTFLRPNFFSRLFRLFPAPTNCPWVSEDGALLNVAYFLTVAYIYIHVCLWDTNYKEILKNLVKMLLKHVRTQFFK